MAFNFGSSGEAEDGVLGDINITPLVDVMLVLLIIFTITAPMLHQGIEVALPKSEAPNLPSGANDPRVRSIAANGLVYVKDKPVHPTKLLEVLTPLVRG